MSEQGHAKNLENLKKARGFAVGWGAKYAPTNDVLSLTNMDTVITAGETVTDELQAVRTPYRNATAAAEDAFAPVSKRITRVMNALKVSGVSQSVIDDAQTYARKIKGQTKKAPVDDPSTPDVNESASGHSTSQMSRVQRIENLDSLRSLLGAQPPYKPNEADLNTPGLTDWSTDLTAKTAAVQTTFVPLSNKLGERDDVYYAEGTGIVPVGKLFKLYVQAAFGRDSVEWNQVKDLQFVEIGRR